MSERRTITVGMNPGDASAKAQEVAENLRTDGKTVTVGEEYDNVTTRYYGMRSVDIFIEDAPILSETVTETVSAAGEPVAAAVLAAPAETIPPEMPTTEDAPDVPRGTLEDPESHDGAAETAEAAAGTQDNVEQPEATAEAKA